MASPYGHYAEILEDILKELQKRKRRKNPPNRFHYRINFRSDRRLLGVAYGLIAVTIIVEGERIFMMSEIGEVKLEKDTAMYIYDADGNLVISISDTADNFDLLAQNLEWHNKKIKEVSRLEMLRALPRELIKEIRKSRHKER